MTEAFVNGKQEFQIRIEDGKYFFGNDPSGCDIHRVNDSYFHILMNGNSFRVLVNKIDHDEREVFLVINGKKAKVKLSSELDKLLTKLGMNGAATKKAAFVKAPMPGMIYSIRVSEGDLVKKGDAVLILEAMKMENVIKSPGDGSISKIHVKPGMSVEKGQLLVTFG